MQEASGGEERERSRRLVHRKALDDKGRFDGRPVVATRFVRACPKGHVDDLDWRRFVHGAEDNCRQQLWLDERGTSGDLADLVVRCECRKSRGLYEATVIEAEPARHLPRRAAVAWQELERGLQSAEPPAHPHRLQRLLSAGGERAVAPGPRDGGGDGRPGALGRPADRRDARVDLAFLKKKPKIAEKLAPFADEEVLEAIRETKERQAAPRGR